MFKDKKNSIQLTDKEKLILIRSLEEYSDELLKIIDNKEIHNNKLIFVCVNDYFNSVQYLKNKIEGL